MAGLFPALLWTGAFLAQAAETKVDSLVGEVTAVAAEAHGLTLKADNGDAVAISIAENASVLRAKPGAKSLAEATATTLPEIAVGDRVLVRGARSADGASLAARQVVVMAKDDIARKQEAERADWRRRGILGTVTAVDAERGRDHAAATARRRWRDPRHPYRGSHRGLPPLRPRLGEVQRRQAEPPGRGAGRGPASCPRRPEHRTRRRFLAEQVVFGSFRTVAGGVAAVDAAKSGLTLTDEESGKKLTVGVKGRTPGSVACRRDGGAARGSPGGQGARGARRGSSGRPDRRGAGRGSAAPRPGGGRPGRPAGGGGLGVATAGRAAGARTCWSDFRPRPWPS